MFSIDTSNVIYDYNTKNKSFVEVSDRLKAAGVKNHKFMLALYNKALLDIDPHDPNISFAHQLLVIDECKINPWYFLREIVRIPSDNGLIPYIATKGNITQAWCILNDIDSWLTSERQTYKTVSLMALFTWLHIFYITTGVNKIGLLHKSKDNSNRNLSIIKKIIESLPEAIFKSIISGFYINNIEKIEHLATNAVIETKAKATSYSQAANIGRSLSYPIQHFDDAGFISHIREILDSSTPVYEAISKCIDTNGKGIHARIFSCVDINDEVYDDIQSIRTARAIVNTMLDWDDHMFDNSYDVNHRIISKRGNIYGIIHISDTFIMPKITEKQARFLGSWDGQIPPINPNDIPNTFSGTLI